MPFRLDGSLCSFFWRSVKSMCGHLFIWNALKFKQLPQLLNHKPLKANVSITLIFIMEIHQKKKNIKNIWSCLIYCKKEINLTEDPRLGFFFFSSFLYSKVSLCFNKVPFLLLTGIGLSMVFCTAAARPSFIMQVSGWNSCCWSISNTPKSFHRCRRPRQTFLFTTRVVLPPLLGPAISSCCC